MADPILYGAAYSVYTRIARLALLEKNVAYRLEEVDIFAAGGPPAAYLQRQPFARIPAFAHDGFALYETAAIARYVDEAFAGPTLQPEHARGRARVAQLVGILDSYAYRAMVWGIFVERMRKPLRGETADEGKIEAALATTETCLQALESYMGAGSFLAGPDEGLSLADLHAAPMIACLRAAPEGLAALARHPSLSAWWERMSCRPSLQATPSPLIDQRGTI